MRKNIKGKKERPSKLKSLKYPLPPENRISQLYSKFKNEPFDNNGSMSANNNDSMSESNNDSSTIEEQPPTQ